MSYLFLITVCCIHQCIHIENKIIKKIICLWSWSITQSCPTLFDPMDCNLPGSSDHGISQARILEWVAVPFSRGSYQPRDQTQVSLIAGRFFTVWATREAPLICLAAAKSLQSCPTLCDPIDGSPPGSPVPGILQATALAWLPLPSPPLLVLYSVK